MTIKSGRVPAFARHLARIAAFALAIGLGVSSASAGTITVKKIPLPSGDTGTFTLQIKNSSGGLVTSLSNASGGAQLGPVTVAAGNYTVGEVGFGSTNLANYTRTITGVGCIMTPGGVAAVAVTATSSTVCTITNTKTPPATGMIKVKKVLVPATDPGHFNLFIKDSSNTIVGTTANAGNNGFNGPVTVPVGTYTVSETPGFATVGTDYTSAISGAGCNANGTVNVTAGSNITCTITNTKKPTGTITVKKVTVPAVDPGKFTLQIMNSLSQVVGQFANATAPAQAGPVILTSGSTYTVGEIAGTGTNLANYTQTITGAGCIPSSGGGATVNLTAGANVVCTITNTHVSTCTGYPLTADVFINNPMSPFGPQTVDICRGGKVIFHNNNSGAAWTINFVNGPSSFGSVSLASANGSTGQTLPPLNSPGTDNYLIAGITVQGHIIIH